MAHSQRLTRKEIEHFNLNCVSMSPRERGAFLERWAHEAADGAKCDPAILRDLIKWLSRQVRGERVPRAQIAADAAAIVHFGLRAKKAVASKRCACRSFDAADAIVKRYHSELVRQADPLGMALGIRFTGSTFENGARNIFFVA